MIVKILGTGCPSCKKLEANTIEALKELKMLASIVKVTEIDEIMSYGIMTPPALVLDEQLLSFGQVPSVAEIKELIENRDGGDEPSCSTGCSSCSGCH